MKQINSTVMKILIIINDAPYGSEKAYNALRIATQLIKEDNSVELRIFLMADAVFCTLQNQETPNGYYNIERMMTFLLTKQVSIKLCGSCTNARGLNKDLILPKTEISNMEELGHWILDSDKVINY